MHSHLSITYTDAAQQPPAEEFAQALGLACTALDNAATQLVVNFTGQFVELKDRDKDLAIHVDFIAGNLAHRQQYGGGRGQAIAKAVGLKPGAPIPRVIDATAGLGKDAFVLACLGCPVVMLENSPVVTQLVTDAIQRAQHHPDFSPLLATGFSIINTNSIDYLKNLSPGPEVIYLDPMYPQRKKSAAVKKNMQLLQQLLGHSEENSQLLEAALDCATQRVVVKRPKGAEKLGDRLPTMFINSKKTRYDVYLIPKKGENQ